MYRIKDELVLVPAIGISNPYRKTMYPQSQNLPTWHHAAISNPYRKTMYPARSPFLKGYRCDFKPL